MVDTHKAALELEAIRQRLPHRYPFLLVDRVLELEEARIRALKNVTVNEPCFQGHFPQRAVMPGVLLLEGMAQAAGLLHLHRYPGGIGYLVGVDQARFKRQVVPGDQLIYEAEIVRQRARYCRARARATVAGELVAEALITLATEGT